ncbi:Protein adenylyltransferase SelO [Balamuthia mandrillaris]
MAMTLLLLRRSVSFTTPQACCHPQPLSLFVKGTNHLARCIQGKRHFLATTATATTEQGRNEDEAQKRLPLRFPWETALESVSEELYDEVEPCSFPSLRLRFRNDRLLRLLGGNNYRNDDDNNITDEKLVRYFGRWEVRDDPDRRLDGDSHKFLALRYHGYQFGHYNEEIGDGRGFLIGQIRATDGKLYDLSTKGSGQTPYSRGFDGRLTLKGGVRECLCSEALHSMHVPSSRTLCLIETGESLIRRDEPSPTRSSLLVRGGCSSIRFGTLERLFHLHQKEALRACLHHVVHQYYPHILLSLDGVDARQSVGKAASPEMEATIFLALYEAVVKRTAMMVASFIAAGFCHGVLNTDNMNITGEAFDYGPFAFMEFYNPRFTAAYFDMEGRYSFQNQKKACHWNLEMLQYPFSMFVERTELEKALERSYDSTFQQEYNKRMLCKLGFSDDHHLTPQLYSRITREWKLIEKTISFFQSTHAHYPNFFALLRKHFRIDKHYDILDLLQTEQAQHPTNTSSFSSLFPPSSTVEQQRPVLTEKDKAEVKRWMEIYNHVLSHLSHEERRQVHKNLVMYNLFSVPTRPHIERLWHHIDNQDDWQPFQRFMQDLLSGD